MNNLKIITVIKVVRASNLEEVSRNVTGWNIMSMVGIDMSTLNEDYSYIYLSEGPEYIEVAEPVEDLLARWQKLSDLEITFDN